MNVTNLHSHSHFCDGKGSPEAFILEAVRQRFRNCGFSAHAPLPFACDWAMPETDIAAYRQTICRLKKQYAGGIEIYLGMEADYFPGLRSPATALRQQNKLDYLIGAIHFVDVFADGTPWCIDGSTDLFLKGVREIFSGSFRTAVQRYFSLIREMIRQSPPDILAHLDKIAMHNAGGRFFDEDASWYRREILTTLEVISQAPTVVEINTRGFYHRQSTFSPAPWIFKELRKRNMPVTLNSDCHHPTEIAGGFDEARQFLREAGIQHQWSLSHGQWQDFPV